MRSRFDEQLSILNRELTQMGAMCEEIIALAAKCLDKADEDVYSRVNSLEEDIDHMEHEIESLCLRLILQQQPVARDLRLVSSALKMITDMERIGDQAADISEIAGFINDRQSEERGYIKLMAEADVNMMTESIDAFVNRDVSLAQKAIAHDDIVDNYFDKTKKSLIKMIAENPLNEDDGEYAIDLIMIAKYFERIGDHAVNIAEWVEFSVTGVHKGEVL